MNEHKMNYIPITNQKDSIAIRLRHLKYVNSVNYGIADHKHKRMANNNHLAFRKKFYSLKVSNKLEVSQSQSNNTVEPHHLIRLAKGFKKVSFLQIYGPLFINPEEDKLKGMLLTQSKNLKSLGFSYEVQDPNFSDYEKFYDTVLTLNGSYAKKTNPKLTSENICTTLQNLKVVLPRDIVFVVDFRVSNETLDNPPVNRLTHNNENYIWNLAASYFTLTNTENSYAYKFESLLNVRKVFLSCESSNSSFDYFKQFLNKLPHIDTLHLQLKEANTDQKIYFKDLTSVVKTNSNLKNFIIDCDKINFDPAELAYIEIPNDLNSLQLNLKTTQITNPENLSCIEQFPRKLKHLNKLKVLNLSFPTTFFMNQMIHNIPTTLHSMEQLILDFPENSQLPGDEDIYLNSLLEVVCTMPNLKEFYIKTSKLNYTYCAYLSHEHMPTTLKKLQWIDETLDCSASSQKELNTKQWIECKKFEDLNIIMRLLTEELEHLEIPFVFDGLESEFVALRFLEILSRLKNLKKLNLSLGFKTLDESNVEAINNFISKIRQVSAEVRGFHMNLNVYYRKIKGDIKIEDLSTLSTKVESTNIYNVQYIKDLYS